MGLWGSEVQILSSRPFFLEGSFAIKQEWFMFKSLFQYFFPKSVMSGKMLSTKFDPNTGEQHTTTFSPYSELEYTTSDNALLVRFVMTYGFERVPKGHPYANMSNKSLRQWSADGFLPCVGEIYFINSSDDIKAIEPVSLKMLRDSMTFDNEIEIQPDRIHITPPLVAMGLNFSIETDVEFSFKYHSEVINVKGLAQRLSVEEINEKYSS